MENFAQGRFSRSAWLQQPIRKNPCRSNDIFKHRAVHLMTLRDTICQCGSKLGHSDLQGPGIRNDEADIKSLIDLMENNWLNPLSPGESDIVSLSTGTVTPPGVVNDLLKSI